MFQRFSERKGSAEPTVSPRRMQNTQSFFDGGQMGALMRAKDWSTTPLGLPETWPQSLTTAVRIILQSRYPMFVWWGKELTNLYNDPYSPFLGKKHPAALGRSASEVWSDIWEQIGPRTEAVLSRGESTFDERLLLMMDRYGYLEETYFTFSYSPLPNDEGDIGGIFCAVTEETERVIGERRLWLLRKVASQTSGARTPEAVCALAADCLKEADRDLPFVLIYLHDESSNTLRRAANVGIAASHKAAPDSVSCDVPCPWRMDEVMSSGSPLALDDLATRATELPSGAWATPPQKAFVMPLAQQGQLRPLGVLVAGANPHRQIGEDFTGFVSLLAGQLAAALANANAYEVERKRAEALAELDRAKTAFFSNVSHEFRTPITLLLGPLEEALADGTRAAKDTERLETAHRNALRLLKLVNSLLDFSRIEAGREQATFEPIDIARFTAELASGFRSLIEQAGLQLTVDCPPLEAEVFIDREMWEKIILNLISNAYKFTLQGEIKVTQQLLRDRVVLSISDTGGGIPEHELPNVFKRFYRIDGVEGRSFEGTGIGLALVQELVKLHGGSVAVESKLGRGTTFTVSIPAGKVHLPIERLRTTGPSSVAPQRLELFVEEAGRWSRRPGSVNQPGSTAVAETTPSEKPKLLVVDDNPDMRDYIRRLLSDRYDLRFATHGEEGVALAVQDIPDLVLTDVMMPVLDGVGMVSRLRSDMRTQTVPIIMLSARAGEEARVAGLESGADDYLTKPFTAAELSARVATHIKMARMRKEAELRERGLRAQAEKAQQKAANILDSINDAFITLDRDFRITYVNPEAARINGKPAEEFIGKSHWEEWPASVGSELERQYRRAMTERVPVQFKHHYVDESHDVHLEINAYPTDDGLAVYFHDVTEMEKTQEALLRSEKLAAMGRLAASIAHEINNPLASVTNLLYLIESCAVVDEVKKYAKMADQELRRVAQIATQTLRFHRQSSAPSDTVISNTLNSILTLYHGRLVNAGIVVEKELRDKHPIRCLEGEVRQALTNLIANAVDAMPHGGRLLVRTKEVRTTAHGHNGVTITIADTGIGMSPAVRRHLFEAFFTTKGITGTGLGLWISKGIVDKHLGKIRVRTSEQASAHGTVFQIFLPAEASGNDLAMSQNASVIS